MTATAALEVGAIPYAKGLVDYQFKHYVRADGMIWSQAVELPAMARMLTVLALYWEYTDDDATLYRYFDKAHAVYEVLVKRWQASRRLERSDPRYGIPEGDDTAAENIVGRMHRDVPRHFYASAAEMYRACTDLGAVWAKLGARTGNAQIAADGQSMRNTARLLLKDLNSSMAATVNTSGSVRCWQASADNATKLPDFRGYSEMLNSGVLTKEQVEDIYTAAAGHSTQCGATKFLTLGSPGLAGFTSMVSSSPGFAAALLQVWPFLDMCCTMLFVPCSYRGG